MYYNLLLFSFLLSHLSGSKWTSECLILSYFSFILASPFYTTSAISCSDFLCCVNFKEWGIWSVPILLFIINRATPTTVSGWHASSSIWITFTTSWQSSFNSSGHYNMSQCFGISASAFLLFLNHSLNTFWSFFIAYCKSFG